MTLKLKWNPSFDTKVENALESVAKKITSTASSIVGKEASGSGELANSYKYEVTEDKIRVYSDSPHALFVEYGTGQRGSEGFESYFKEEKPSFTIPIKPKNKKALHWVDKGKQVFAKSSKGMKPVAPLRRAVFMILGKELETSFKKGFK